MKTYSAYDYETQRWVQGDQARQLLIQQEEKNIAIFEGPGGLNFVLFNRIKESPAECAEICRQRIAEWKAGAE